MDVCLLIEDFLWPEFWHRLPAKQLQPYQLLLRLLGKSQRQGLPAATLDAAFQQCFQRPLPVQALAMAHQLPQQYPYWLSCAFCYMQVNHDGILALPITDQSVSDAQWQQLLTDLNAWLSQDAVKIHRIGQHFVLNSADYAALDLPPFSMLAGQNLQAVLDDCQPLESSWLRLLTEIQMWLSQYPLNLQRMQQGLPTIASLWAWGAASADVDAFKGLYTVGESDWARGMAALCQGKQLADWHTTLANVSQGNTILQIDSQLSMYRHDVTLWSQQLAEVYAQQILPVLQGLKAGTIQQLKLFLGNQTLYQIHSQQARYVWPWQTIQRGLQHV